MKKTDTPKGRQRGERYPYKRSKFYREFDRDDREEDFLADAAVLRSLIRNCNNTNP